MSRFRIVFFAGAFVALAAAYDSPPVAETPLTELSADDLANVNRAYGPAIKLGEGRARSYVLTDNATGAPVEIGVALDERALEGLPKSGSGHHDGHMVTHEYIVQLPERHGTPFNFMEMNWNPMGHEPEGVYQDVPHFDFHFYTISKDERDAIVPTDSQWARKANNVPAAEYVPEFNAALGPPGMKPEGFAVPKMGVHWVDVRSAELQKLLGKPEAYKPFTATFIHGSWDGRVIFWEPMVTRAFILSKKSATDPAARDEVIPIPSPKRYQVPGYYPSGYRIAWDADAKEYRIALTGLMKKS